MKRILPRILTATALICTSFLSGCSFILATENSAPYTPDDVIAMVEKEFAACHPHIILKEMQIEKEKPFQRNRYVLYDETNDFTFSCKAVLRRPTLPLPCAERDTNAFFSYAAEYAAHLNEKVRTMTAQYGFRTATGEEAATLIQSKTKRRQGDMEFPLFDEGDFIFVSNGAKGSDMVTICKNLYDMYKPKGDGTLLSALYGPKITFYYVAPEEENLTKAIFLMFFTLEGRNDWAATLSDNPGSSSAEKDTEVLEKNLARYFEKCLHGAQTQTRQRSASNHPL